MGSTGSKADPRGAKAYYYWGFMYNGGFAALGVGSQEVKAGDTVRLAGTWMDLSTYASSAMTAFANDSYKIKAGEKATFTLIALPDGWSSTSKKAVAGAELIVNEAGTGVKTGSDGKASLTFDKAGAYTITAKKLDASGITPYAPLCEGDGDARRGIAQSGVENRRLGQALVDEIEGSR